MPRILPQIKYAPLMDDPPGGTPPQPQNPLGDIPALQAGGWLNDQAGRMNQGIADWAKAQTYAPWNPNYGSLTPSPMGEVQPPNPYAASTMQNQSYRQGEWNPGVQGAVAGASNMLAPASFIPSPGGMTPPGVASQNKVNSTGQAIISDPRDSPSYRPANTGGSTVPPSALTNNRNNMDAATNAGDTAAMARLDAEWKRIAPLAGQWGITPERLVNSYMQSDNPAAKSDLGSALAAARTDDIWAQEAVRAGVLSGIPNNPADQRIWDEHWHAMNVGGRDPLDGHTQAVLNIKAQMNADATANQGAQSASYQQWLAGQH